MASCGQPLALVRIDVFGEPLDLIVELAAEVIVVTLSGGGK